MKSKIKTLMIIAASIFLLSSCAGIHSGTMISSTALSEPNFTYVKRNLQGKASAMYVLGIGGLKRQTLVEEAKQDMLFSETGSNLAENQALANVTINFKHTFILFGLYMKVTCTVGGDVIQFVDRSQK